MAELTGDPEVAAGMARGGALLPQFRRGALGLALVVTLGAGVMGCGGGDDGGGGSGESAAGGHGGTSTSLETGGIDVAAPDGWQAIPLPQLGFGVAVPEGWEAAVLTAQTLSDLESSAPAVPGFLDAAHAAAQSGSVFYAAGADDQGRVTDLKVRASPDAGVTDAAGLEAFVRQLATEEGLAEPEVMVVEGAAVPTVEVRYRTTAQRPADADTNANESGGTATTEPAPVDVDVRGTERVVLGPEGVVYSLIVTSEDLPDHDATAAAILDTLAFPAP